MKTLSGQTVTDVLIQEAGTVNRARDFLRANGLAFDDHFDSNEDIVPPERKVPELVTYFREREIKIVTGEPNPKDYPGLSYGTSYGSAYD